MIKNNLERIQNQILNAARRSSRDPGGIQLVLVTKQVGPADVQAAYDLGVRDFGENRVQELLSKKEKLPQDIRWHLIGHLQTNKVKQVLGRVSLIHSLDRLDLAKEIQKKAENLNQTIPVLIQVNSSYEETKFGFDPEGVEKNVDDIILHCHCLDLCGLMTIGPNTNDETLVRGSFSKLRKLQEKMKQRFSQFNWNYLSMGMSSDFEIAIEEGANILRIGTAVFGPRNI